MSKDIIEQDDNLEIDPDEIVQFDTDAITQEAFQYADALVGNLQAIYGNEKLMKEQPRLKKKIDAELDTLTTQLKMRFANEQIHDILVRSIGKDPTNASLYMSLKGLQMATVKIQDKIDVIIDRLTKSLRNIQLELNFEQSADDSSDDTSSDDTPSEIKLTKGNKDFILQMKESEDNN